ncbi:LemA family protein [Clostridiaceae bacterium UIB06]|uniref:LemA family protein n=1 Tax=Clostridium thailandense TaxID=2794346 RepID=A0A949TV57_9CLOT|nr:LemA family protein [Clostridium thailandense]MBV7274091.1 LemA family protein [Clostridium thailandense]MCH5137685.1 LemA family protein [Clostridiaceae bacterium UIB06]
MNKGLKISLIILAVLAIIFLPLIGSYNSIVGLEQKVNAAESNIDAQLQRRSDLIPNLVQTVKGYAAQEKTIFTDVANARAKLAGAQTITDRANADAQLSSSLSRLLVVVERYPDLKSNQNFKDLSVALEGTENRIAIARQDYNNYVNDYNTSIKRFPNSIVSGMFGFSQKPYYKASQGAQEVPKVDFTK